jgi:aspartate ammonia-lyase
MTGMTGTTGAVATREDHDSLGSLLLPADVYYGVHTERARQNFSASGSVLGDFPAYLTSIVQVKKAAALANADVGVIRPDVAEAIGAAADEVADQRFERSQFPVDMMSGGGGVSTNMNVNEVLANRANEILCGRLGYEFVHPNNHVNAGQSTSDVVATAINLTLYRAIGDLVVSVRHLEEVILAKMDEYKHVVKLSRTCLQDAVPVMFSQEFGAYLAVASRGVDRLTSAAEMCLDVPMGATVIGTGLGIGAGYVERVYPRLREVTGLAVRRHPNFFDAYQNGDVFQSISGTFKALATNLSKMSRDLRILSSTSVGELALPAVQAGSSFMPGKVNPVMPEFMIQIAYQVCGNDTVVTMAVEGAELDFNAWSAVIAKNMFESARLLTLGIPLFADKCLRDLRVQSDHCQTRAGDTLALSSLVAGIYGYEAGARAAKHARAHGTSIRQAVLDLRIVPEEDVDILFDLETLTDGSRSSSILDRMAARERHQVAEKVAGIPVAARLSIFEAAVAVARADRFLAGEEARALEVLADALQVPVKPDELDALLAGDHDGAPVFGSLDELDAGSRRLVYSCAVWMANVDDEEAAAESLVLDEIRASLGLDDEVVRGARATVANLGAERTEYVPRSEQLPWWEEFDQLLLRIMDPRRHTAS